MAEDAIPTNTLHEEGDGEHAHPSWRTYALIAVVLTVITAAEVAVFYIEALQSMLVPILLALSAAKFALVVMFYMHLKFDSKVFTGVFAGPLLLAVLLVLAMVLLFNFLPLFTL